MPFINARTTVKIDLSTKEKIKSELGQAIRILPGKSEQWLMVGFQDGYDLYFQGNQNEETAFIEVKVYGKAKSEDYDKLTKRITDIFHSDLKIPSERIYVEYEETPFWGFDGTNF
ncbi:MAG: phenylpyruvate tautomerase MIF-related protein [Bacilli bacterium]